VPRWVTVFGRVNNLGVELGTQAYSASAHPLCRLEWVPGECWGSKQAHRVIHQPVSMVLQCGADAWLYRMASRDQRQLAGSGSASEACSRRCAIHITLLYLHNKWRITKNNENRWPYKVILIKLELFLDKSIAGQDALESGKSTSMSCPHSLNLTVLLVKWTMKWNNKIAVVNIIITYKFIWAKISWIGGVGWPASEAENARVKQCVSSSDWQQPFIGTTLMSHHQLSETLTQCTTGKICH